jgi:glycosyltransferase involved in cell wall biosynthesis
MMARENLKPKYSIIIPSLNSENFLSVTLPLILRSNCDNFEVIVSNNNSSDGTSAYLEKIQDPRVIKVRPQIRLSMQEHYEFALSHARGEWINLLGADDFPLPTMFSEMDKLLSKSPSADIVTWTRSYFFWPGVEEIYGDVRLSYTELKTQRKKSSQRTFVLALLGQHQILDLPQLYTCSFVSARLIGEIKKNGGGCFYTDSIPDIYSSVELLLTSSSFIRIAYPLTLVGSSKTSLGSGERIYLDHELNNSTKQNLLSEQTDKELHMQKISPYFLLDCYLSYVAKHSLEIRKSFVILALIGVSGEFIRRKEFLQKFKLMRRAAQQLDVPTFWLSIAVILSVPNLVFRLLREVYAKVLKRVLHAFSKDSVKIHATSKSKIVDLEHALEAIDEIRSKKPIR